MGRRSALLPRKETGAAPASAAFGGGRRGEVDFQSGAIGFEGTDAGQVEQQVTSEVRSVVLVLVDHRVLVGPESPAHRAEVQVRSLRRDRHQRAGREYRIALRAAAALDRDHVAEQVVVEIQVGAPVAVCLLFGAGTGTRHRRGWLINRDGVTQPPPQRLR